MDSIAAGTTVAYVLEGVQGGFFKPEDFVCQDYCPLAPDKKLGYVLCGRSDTWPAHGLQL
jgi:hypothetical protein